MKIVILVCVLSAVALGSAAASSPPNARGGHAVSVKQGWLGAKSAPSGDQGLAPGRTRNAPPLP